MWHLADKQINSRLLIGSALYSSPKLMQQAVKASGSEVVTVSLRRQTAFQGTDLAGTHNYWELLRELDLNILPNTAGCTTAKEAINTANMARELFATNWIKLEVIGDEHSLHPDPFALLEATQELTNQGFEVFPYCTDDLILCEKLVAAGCRILMPWGAPIGTGKGLVNPYALNNLRQRLPDITLIVDAGIGAPSHAAQALEMGYDAVLLNTAVARSPNPVNMAKAFRAAVEAGHLAYKAGIVATSETAQPSTPTLGTPFWHQG
jgi:thiazole synthase